MTTNHRLPRPTESFLQELISLAGAFEPPASQEWSSFCEKFTLPIARSTATTLCFCLWGTLQHLPHPLSPNAIWLDALLNGMPKLTGFSDVFAFEENTLIFATSLTELERNAIRDYVAEHYNPPIMD